MSRYHSYLNTAKAIINAHTGQQPLAIFLKSFFSKEKKYGSKDRKQIASLCYHYYRVAAIFDNSSVNDRQLLIATFLCERVSSDILKHLMSQWDEQIDASLAIKKEILQHQFETQKLFPFTHLLSADIDTDLFAASFLSQPHLYIRIRPGYEKIVSAKLQLANLTFNPVHDYCLALSNSSKVENVIEINKEAVIQDCNSQRTGEIIHSFIDKIKTPSIWDCCAASGGKSIMLWDISNTIQLTVSDVRQSILSNLHRRFQQAGIQQYKSFIIDLTQSAIQLSNGQTFDVILADVPCTGSGTWARTPEQLYFFKENTIEYFTQRQQKIIENVIPFLKSNGYLIYITCSVFKQENEAMVAYMIRALNLQLMQMELLKGYDQLADTLFIAVLQKVKDY